MLGPAYNLFELTTTEFIGPRDLSINLLQYR